MTRGRANFSGYCEFCHMRGLTVFFQNSGVRDQYRTRPCRVCIRNRRSKRTAKFVGKYKAWRLRMRYTEMSAQYAARKERVMPYSNDGNAFPRYYERLIKPRWCQACFASRLRSRHVTAFFRPDGKVSNKGNVLPTGSCYASALGLQGDWKRKLFRAI